MYIEPFDLVKVKGRFFQIKGHIGRGQTRIPKKAGVLTTMSCRSYSFTLQNSNVPSDFSARIKWVLSEYAKFVSALPDILSGLPPVLWLYSPRTKCPAKSNPFAGHFSNFAGHVWRVPQISRSLGLTESELVPRKIKLFRLFI